LIAIAALCFAAAWLVMLLFDAWGNLHFPNPLAWTPGERKMALYASICVAIIGVALSKLPRFPQ